MALGLKGYLCFKFAQPVSKAGDGILFFKLHHFTGAGTGNQFLFPILCLTIFIFDALYINRIVNESKLFPKPNFLPGMCFILISTFIVPLHQFNAALLASPLILLMLSMIFRLANSSSPASTAFNLGFIGSLASLIYYPCVVFLILAFIGLSFNRPFKLKEWVTVVVGTTTPIYFLLSYIYLTDGNISMPYNRLYYPQNFWRAVPYILTYAIIAIHAIGGFVLSQQYFNRQVVHVRQNWKVVYLLLCLSFGLAAFYFFRNHESRIFLIMPVSILGAAIYFYIKRKWVSLLLYTGSLVFAVYIAYVYKFPGL